MITLAVTEQQLEQLRIERFQHPHPRVQLKMEVIFLRANGISVKEVCRLTGVSPNTYRNYLRDFLEGGVDGLKRFDCAGTTSELERHADQLAEAFVQRPVRTLAEARERVHELTGIYRSREQIRQFMRRLGFKPLKVGSRPAKADGDAQADFKKSPRSKAR